MSLQHAVITVILSAFFAGGLYAAGHILFAEVEYDQVAALRASTTTPTVASAEETPSATPSWPLPLDVAAYNARLLDLVRYEPPAVAATATATAPVSNLRFSSTTNVTVAGRAWPPAAPLPHGGAILPFERIIAYYGNFYSTRMGILGEYDQATVLQHLRDKKAAWEAADPETPVRPAIHYIAMVAQADGGADGMYRAVMPDEHIERAFRMAEEVDGIVFLDLQVGLSTIERELPQFREFMQRPNAHLGLDPEFSMKTGDRPGTVIGTYDAADINFSINWLSEIVREHKLPPKVLVVHRFTQNMVTNYQDIKPTPEVQVVMHMDGWGSKDLKRGTYGQVIIPEPVQFTGVKVFYKNDLKPPSTGLLTPAELLSLTPKPVYIQYQ
jgi:hypothetical protein